MVQPSDTDLEGTLAFLAGFLRDFLPGKGLEKKLGKGWREVGKVLERLGEGLGRVREGGSGRVGKGLRSGWLFAV